jgi:hypothetical protein
MKNEIEKAKKNELVLAKEIIEKYQPNAMIKSHRNIKTISDIMKTENSGISALVKQVGEDKIQALIELHIWQLNSTMNLNNKLNETQVMEIAIEIMSIYFYLSIEDIFLVFRKAKRGEFGKVFGSLGMIDIFEWFKKYDEERTKSYIQSSTKNVSNDNSKRSSEKDSEAFHIAKLIHATKKPE